MEKVNAIFKLPDSYFDIEYTVFQTAYRVNQNNIISMLEPDMFIIEQITSETEDAVIVDEKEKEEDDDNYQTPIYIELENVYGIDLSNPSVLNFAKYLVELRDNE